LHNRHYANVTLCFIVFSPNIILFCLALPIPFFGVEKFSSFIGIQVRQDDIHISYLPLAHVFERAVLVMFTSVGARAGFYQGDTLKLLDDVGMFSAAWIYSLIPCR
jgi:hypothetical protein